MGRAGTSAGGTLRAGRRTLTARAHQQRIQGGTRCDQHLPKSSGCVTHAAMLLALPPNQNGYRIDGPLLWLLVRSGSATAILVPEPGASTAAAAAVMSSSVTGPAALHAGSAGAVGDGLAGGRRWTFFLAVSESITRIGIDVAGRKLQGGDVGILYSRIRIALFLLTPSCLCGVTMSANSSLPMGLSCARLHWQRSTPCCSAASWGYDRR